jgi:methionyl aminopeptidase
VIVIKSPAEIEKIAAACRIVAEVLDGLRSQVKPGASTADLESYADNQIRRKKAIPAFRGYRGYPASMCVSVNNQVVHGIPSRHTHLRNGDIVSIDLGVLCDGFYGDAAVTLPVGEVSEDAAKLMRVTEESLMLGIEKAVPGNRVSDISSAVQRHVESHSFSVVRAFVGHGIGRSLHEDPQVPNFGAPGQGSRLRAGMTLAIEPMVNGGGPDVTILDDGWTAVTSDGSLSAHFEHTVAVTKNGPLILTKI